MFDKDEKSERKMFIRNYRHIVTDMLYAIRDSGLEDNSRLGS